MLGVKWSWFNPAVPTKHNWSELINRFCQCT